jgi:hypothetical protein
VSNLCQVSLVLAWTVFLVGACTPQEEKLAIQSVSASELLTQLRLSHDRKDASASGEEDPVRDVARIIVIVACKVLGSTSRADVEGDVLTELGWTTARYARERKQAAKSARFYKELVQVMSWMSQHPKAKCRSQFSGTFHRARETIRGLMVASACMKKAGLPPDEMTQILLALYRQQTISAERYSELAATLSNDARLQREVSHMVRQCPGQVGPNRIPPQAVKSRRSAEKPGTDEVQEAVSEEEVGLAYIGPLHGRASGRVSLTITQRSVKADIVIGGLRISATGKLDRKQRISFAGRTGKNHIQFRGKLSPRSNVMRGNYKGLVQLIGRSDSRHVYGLWSAKRRE